VSTSVDIWPAKRLSGMKELQGLTDLINVNFWGDGSQLERFLSKA
jgi:hypothetical protein